MPSASRARREASRPAEGEQKKSEASRPTEVRAEALQIHKQDCSGVSSRKNEKLMELRQKLALGLWLLTVGVSAQTDVWRSDSLQEVVVTGTGTQHLLKDAPVQTEVISHRQLQQYAGKSIEDILSGLSASKAQHILTAKQISRPRTLSYVRISKITTARTLSRR